jgi:D-amino-acid oxidase
MDTTLYLPWLIKLLQNKNVPIIQKALSNFSEAFEQYDIVVNCSGLGSRELCNDDRVYPVRGQVVRVKLNGFDSVVSDESNTNLTYIIPRFKDIIIGGTAQENDWNLEVDPKDTADILAKAKLIATEFEDVTIIDEKVGLRPARDEVRLEAERFGDKSLIHNYGHGGAGFTLSWGCAEDVVKLVNGIVK